MPYRSRKPPGQIQPEPAVRVRLRHPCVRRGDAASAGQRQTGGILGSVMGHSSARHGQAARRKMGTIAYVGSSPSGRA
jgi:hypothetical protein